MKRDIIIKLLQGYESDILIAAQLLKGVTIETIAENFEIAKQSNETDYTCYFYRGGFTNTRMVSFETDFGNVFIANGNLYFTTPIIKDSVKAWGYKILEI